MPTRPCWCRLRRAGRSPPAPGRGWKVTLGAAGRDVARVRWGGRTLPAAGSGDPALRKSPGARVALGVAGQPRFSSPAPGSPLTPPPILRTWAGLERRPARRMTLEGKLPALPAEVQRQLPRRGKGRLLHRRRRVVWLFAALPA